ncbi:MAG: flavodoxin family protein [Actinomycetes bacterium]|jgi:multimeric flavodoxin WrbA|nr:flavodoxin family protein [Actinomycetes bacterium]
MKKVLLVNGSPHKHGSTATALAEAAATLTETGVESEVFHLGNGPFYGCIACRACNTLGHCRYEDDPANALAEAIKGADGVIIGSPTYYASANGALCAVLDRSFYSQSSQFAGKPAAAIVVCRRGGAASAFDRLNKYFTISQMPVVSSQYWNHLHGTNAEEVKQDAEGLQTIRVLARNMANMLKHAPYPTDRSEPRAWTNFIR